MKFLVDAQLPPASITTGGPRVPWVRTGNLVNRLLLARFERAWAEIEAHLSASAMVVELR